ncbi:MAG: PAS domain-containing protein [Opitutaceae bacterium]
MPAPSEPGPARWEIPEIFLSSPFGVCLLDAQGILRAANLEAARILRLGPETKGSLFTDCTDEASRPDVIALLEREALTETGLPPTSIRFILGDGIPRHLEISSTRGASLPPGARLLILHELGIDDHARSYDRSILLSLMEVIPDNIYFKDRQSRFLRINRSHANHFGLSDPEQAVGKTDFDFFTPEHAQPAFDEEQEILRTGIPVINREQKETLHDGRIYWVSTTKLPFYDREDKIIGTFGISRDITENKKVEQALYEERNLLRTLIDILPSRIFIKDLDSRFVINNRSHLDQLKVKTQEEAIGKSTYDFYPTERGQQALDDDREVLATGKPIINREKTYLDDDGEPVWSLTTKVPLKDSNGRMIGLVGISHDITERKRAEQELTRRNQEMQADLKMAREIQQSLLTHHYPSFPEGAAPEDSILRFAHRYIPASSLAGDFFDIVQVSDSEAGILVCDVMGHGVKAALVTAFIRGLVEELMPLASRPGDFLSELNRAIFAIFQQSESRLFVTTLYCVADTGRGQLRYANGGHPAPYLIHEAGDSVTRIRPEDYDPEPALGLINHFQYSTWEHPLTRKDRLIAFTDGLFEIDGPDGEQLGENWLFNLVHENRRLSLEDLFDHLLKEARHQLGSNEFEDDVCLVGSRIEDSRRSDPAIAFEV